MITKHFFYDRRRSYIELFCSSNNSIYDRLRPYKKCLFLILGRGHAQFKGSICPKTVMYGTSNIVLFDEKKYVFPHNITTVLVFSVRQDFNGCDCADPRRPLQEIVGFIVKYETKTKFVAGKLCVK